MKSLIMLIWDTLILLLGSTSISLAKKESSAKRPAIFFTILAGWWILFVQYETQVKPFSDQFFLASNYILLTLTATVLFAFSFATLNEAHRNLPVQPEKVSLTPQALSNYSGLLLAGFFTPFGFDLFSTMSRTTVIQIGPTILLTGYSIGIIVIACAWFRKQSVLSPARLTREAAIESMEDGWVMVDVNQCIVDSNPAAERFLGKSKETMYGQPISDFLVEWPNIIQIPDTVKEFEIRRSLKTQNEWRYVNIYISILTDQHQGILGYLIRWHDVTQHKLAENARQKAREELFILLNGISSASSQAMSLDDFLLESINQVVYPFHSQAIGVFMFNQDSETITLTAHSGLSKDAADGMQVLPASNNIWKEIIQTNQHILIDDRNDNSLLRPKMQKLGYASILALPLSIRLDDTIVFLGCMFLAKEEQSFSNDEIIRLNIIAEHISMLIDNNRRRHYFILTSERQRLMRDLHDSVSQKLYGLVATTEAAQAALEAGLEIDPSQILAKIGDNARHAVREMRLFLYQMQPVDLENEGLVEVLNHRLAAVEGRSNIKTRFLADENISLSKQKETALYFIAQETLNNILKHAHAQSVSVILKKTRKNIILEIQDDGIGFNIKKLDGAGLGLKNLRERVSQVGGKLRILSKPGNGTKITVQVSIEKKL